MNKAYSYQRFSSLEQSKGDSLRRQTTGAADYAARNGLVLDDTLSLRDLGVSGYTGKNQQGALGVFLKAIENGLVLPGSVLIVEALDRLSRQDPWATVMFIVGPILMAGVDIVTLYPSERRYSYNPGQPTNMLQLMEIVVFASAANEESYRKSLRGQANWQQKRLNAVSVPLTAKLPAWCCMVVSATGKRERIELIPERAEVVKQIFKDYLADVGQVTIAKRMNLAGVPCWGKAAMWYTSYISKILSSPSVTGVYIPHTLVGGKGGKRIQQQPIHGYFPAIISEADYNKVQSMRQFGCFTGRKPEVHNILSNLAKCPLCGSTMRRVRNGARAKAKLICVKAKGGKGCLGYGADYQSTEAALLAGVPTIKLTVPGLTKQQKVIADLQTTIERHKVGQQNIMQAIESGQQRPNADIFQGSEEVPVTMLQAVQHLQWKIEAGEKELVKLQRGLALVRGDSIRERLRELKQLVTTPAIDRAGINTVLRALCSHIIVDYPEGALLLHFRFGGVYALPMPKAEEAVQQRVMLTITGQAGLI